MLLCAMSSATLASAQCCDLTLSMQDSYGDGWDGAFLEVYVNGNLIGAYEVEGSGTTVNFEICTGENFEIVYTAGDYENEHTYQFFGPSGNVIFSDGPNPDTGTVFAAPANCDEVIVPGSSACSAIPMGTVECAQGDNSFILGTGFNPGCAAYQGADIWFGMNVPPSGNVSFTTSNGGLTDTGIAVWTGESCINISLLGCDDDAAADYYSLLMLFDLEPGTPLYIQVFGYGGGTGSFDLCAVEMANVVLESSELPIIVINTQGNTIVQDVKVNAMMDIKYNGPGNLTFVSDLSNVYSGPIGIEIRGATSAGFPQRPYGLETRNELGENNNVSLLGMPAENDWVLLSNYNDLSLIRNTLAFKLFGEMGNYSVRTQLCEVLIDNSYKGIYVFGEKIKRDNGRVNIARLDLDDNAGDSLTGGYILQQNYWDNQNSFESNYSPVDHPEFDVHFLYQYPNLDSITTPQREYIAAFVDSLEDGLYGENFGDPFLGYLPYLDVPSFIDYFLVNELSRNNDGFKKSVFFHKDRNDNGGKLKMGPVWDFDWAWKDLGTCTLFQNNDGSGWAHLINDCPTDNYSTGWYIRLLQDSTFANELRCTYESYRTNVLDTAYIFAYIEEIRSLVQNAQARHFQKWPILGLGGFAPELGIIAATYDEELDKMKDWIALRIAWLDANIPGQCPPVIIGVEDRANVQPLRVYPNPSNGQVQFQGRIEGSASCELRVLDMTGRIILHRTLAPGEVRMAFEIPTSGLYSFLLTQSKRIIQQGKIVNY